MISAPQGRPGGGGPDPIRYRMTRKQCLLMADVESYRRFIGRWGWDASQIQGILG